MHVGLVPVLLGRRRNRPLILPGNLFAQPSAFDNAAWAKTDTTVTANALTAPDGTLSAELLTQGSAGTAGVAQGVTSSAGAPHSVVVYLKRGNNDWIRLQISDGTNAFQAWFNLATGALGGTANTASPTATSRAIESAGDGWYRCRVTATLTNTSISAAMMAATGDVSGSRASGGTYYAWGGQLLLGTAA